MSQMNDVWPEAVFEGGTSKVELETDAELVIGEALASGATLETEVALASRYVLATRAALTTGAVLGDEAVLAAGTLASGTSVASRELIFGAATGFKGTVKVELLIVGVRRSGGRLCERGELVTERARFKLLWVLT